MPNTSKFRFSALEGETGLPSQNFLKSGYFYKPLVCSGHYMQRSACIEPKTFTLVCANITVSKIIEYEVPIVRTRTG
jgi:hypothetical protein